MTLSRCPSIMGLDLGSRHLGAVVSAEALPLRPLSRRWDVDPRDLGPAADRVRREVDGLAELDGSLPPDVVVEFGALYMPKDVSSQAAQKIAEAHATCGRLLDLIWRACPGPYYQVTTITRASWSHRVVPHTAGGITDVMANDGLRTHVDPDMWAALTSQDERDAAGALVGHLLPAPARSSRYRSRDRRRDRTAPRLSPEERVARSRDMRELRRIRETMVRREKMGTLTADERRAAGCRCIRGHNGGGRCTEDCVLALSYVKRHGTRAGSGRCKLCGGPRKGHLRGLPCPLPPAAVG